MHALVFGCQSDGNIVLIYSSDGFLNMHQPCISHRGNIANIAGSNDLITNHNTPALVTYGDRDKIIKIWSASIIKSSCSISLDLLFCINSIEQAPEKILLSSAVLCLVLKDNQLAMLKLTNKPQSQLFNSSLMKHSHKDDHRHRIHSLVMYSYLQIVITSSKDTIKTWNLDNELLSNLDIGAPVSSVGLASDNGDLLIGTRNIITVLGAEEYLPRKLVTIAKTSPKRDLIEKSIPFNPDLEFW